MDFDILSPTNDFVFKLLFGDDRHKSMLIDMLKTFVNLPDEDFELVFAVDILYEISADDKVRAEYNARQKAWMDRQSQFDGYFKKGKAEGKAETARNLKLLGVSMDLIIKSTGLSQEEIAQL